MWQTSLDFIRSCQPEMCVLFWFGYSKPMTLPYGLENKAINSLSFSIANSKSFALADFGFSPCVREGRGQVKLPIS